MKRVARIVALAMVSGLLTVALGGSPVEARSSSAGFSHADSLKTFSNARKHKKKKKKKKRRRARRPVVRNPWTYCWPGIPTLGTSRLAGAVQFRWAGTSCTTRYRVHVSPGWYGNWPAMQRYTSWTSGSARNTTWTVPTAPAPGDGMTPVAYANPVFGQLEANNGSNTHATATHKSTWVAQWPWAPAPVQGDRVRFGSYNVMLSPTGTRAQAAARNIGTHNLTMVSLQESKQTTAAEIVNTLNAEFAGSWDYVRAQGATVHNPAQQILYRTDLFDLAGSGVFDIANPRDSAHHVMWPWASFRAARQDASYAQTFYVAAVHFAGTASASLEQNAATGAAATIVNDQMNQLTSGPIIVAGDLRYGREPWGDTPGYVPAQPTLVRAGYYDAMASQSMHGQNYNTVNSDSNGTPTATLKPNPSGAGARADNILMKGIIGSTSYYNVVNWSDGGTVPSDHNLIYSDIDIPTS